MRTRRDINPLRDLRYILRKYENAIFATQAICPTGVKGFISYRAEHSEAYRNQVKRSYIAFALRIYRQSFLITKNSGAFNSAVFLYKEYPRVFTRGYLFVSIFNTIILQLHIPIQTTNQLTYKR